jgi:hypothetical protein
MLRGRSRLLACERERETKSGISVDISVVIPNTNEPREQQQWTTWCLFIIYQRARGAPLVLLSTVLLLSAFMTAEKRNTRGPQALFRRAALCCAKNKLWAYLCNTSSVHADMFYTRANLILRVLQISHGRARLFRLCASLSARIICFKVLSNCWKYTYTHTRAYNNPLSYS